MTKHYVGTSGFSYLGWQGIFYPPGVKPKAFLEYYASKFNSLELNASFYHLPKVQVVKGWKERTPPHFRFCPKLSRLITHLRKLESPELPLYTFFKVFEHLKDKLGPILIQLPPTLPLTFDRVEPFFAILKERYHDYRFAIEARHPSWICEEAYKLLKEYDLEWVIADSGGQFPSAILSIKKLAYFRFHGPGALYASEYSLEALREYALVARTFLDHKKDVWAFFNNDVGGYAVKNAMEFRTLIEES